MSSLASQLAQNASLNASILVDRSKRKPVDSYLFSSRDAAAHDLESIFALGLNSFSHLTSINSEFNEFEHALFSDSAKATDRTLLTTEANVQLNQNLDKFLVLLGPYLLEAPASKALEWLVRRFRYVQYIWITKHELIFIAESTSLTSRQYCLYSYPITNLHTLQR